MSDNIRPFTGSTIKVESFRLDDKDVVYIKSVYSKMHAISSLIDDLHVASDFIIDKLVDRYTESRIQYDEWFEQLAIRLDITPTEDQRWSIDFKEKTAKLIG